MKNAVYSRQELRIRILEPSISSNMKDMETTNHFESS